MRSDWEWSTASARRLAAAAAAQARRAGGRRRRRRARAAAGPPRCRPRRPASAGRPCRARARAAARTACAAASGANGQRRRAVGAGEQRAHLVGHLGPAARGQHVGDRLAGQDAADRLGQRRRAAVGPHAVQLGQHLVQAVERVGRPQARVDVGDEADRQARDGGAQDDPRRHRQRRHARRDVRVDEPRRVPDPVDVDAVLDLEARSAPRTAPRPTPGSGATRPDRPRPRSARRRGGPPRPPSRAPCRRCPGSRGRRARPRPRPAARRRCRHVPGSSAPAESCRSTRSAPSSASRRAFSITRSRLPIWPEKARPAYSRPPASRTAAAAAARFSTSFSGSCRRKTSIPLSAADRMKRRTRSSETGFEPTRNRPRTRDLQRRLRAARPQRPDPVPGALDARAAPRRRSSRRPTPRGRRTRRRPGSRPPRAPSPWTRCRPAAAGTGAGRWCRRSGSRP